MWIQSTYAAITQDGIGEWVGATTLPRALRRHSIASKGNVIYVTGGYTDADAGIADVYYAEVNDDGSLGAWSVGTALPEARYYHAAVIHDNQLVGTGWASSIRSRQYRVWWPAPIGDGGSPRQLGGRDSPAGTTLSLLGAVG